MSKGRAAGRATGSPREEAAAPKSPAGGATWGRGAAPRSPRAVTHARTRAHAAAHTPRHTCPEKFTPREHREMPRPADTRVGTRVRPTLEHTTRARWHAAHRYRPHPTRDPRADSQTDAFPHPDGHQLVVS